MEGVVFTDSGSVMKHYLPGPVKILGCQVLCSAFPLREGKRQFGKGNA
jgi:hypothetical protein